MRHLVAPVAEEKRTDRRLRDGVEHGERAFAERAEGELGEGGRRHRQDHGVKLAAARLAVAFPDQPVRPARDDGLDGGVETDGTGGEPGRQGVGEGLQAARERNDGCHPGFAAGLSFLRAGQQAAKERAVRALGLPEHGKGMLDREFFRIASVDAGDERVHGVVDELLVEVRAHQFGEADIGRADARALEQLGEETELGAKGKKAGAQKRSGRQGHRLEAAAPDDVSFFPRGAGGEHPGLELQVLDQLLELGGAVLERIGAGLDEVAVFADGPDRAAGLRAALEQDHLVAALVQPEGGGKTGDAGTHDGNALGRHVRISTWSPCRPGPPHSRSGPGA